jgi:hypothetical protein
MKWIVAVQLMFGLLFAHRTLQQLLKKKLIEESLMKKTSAAVFFILLGITLVCLHSPRWQFVLISSTCACLLSLDLFFERRLKIVIQSQFPEFITRLILSMKTGMSFRSAVDRELQNPKELWQKWLRSMIDARVFLQKSGAVNSTMDPTWWRDWLEELQTVHQNPHHALARLESLRRKLRVLSGFRRKSGQAMLQARIQLLVMTVLYFALLIVTMMQFQILRHQRCLILSLCLFFAGQLLFWRLARKSTWKT